MNCNNCKVQHVALVGPYDGETQLFILCGLKEWSTTVNMEGAVGISLLQKRLVLDSAQSFVKHVLAEVCSFTKTFLLPLFVL